MVKSYFSLARIIRLTKDRKDNYDVLATLIKVYGDNKRKFKADIRRVEAESFMRSGEIKTTLFDLYGVKMSITEINRTLKYLIYRDAIIQQFQYTGRATECYRVATPLYKKVKETHIKIVLPQKVHQLELGSREQSQ
ncbi:MAG: hypothetical protein Q7S22_03010 [Candidatus Micrarchaeota archaeon]|nr:hypothetical protein [Candidatus Micrarchaeota archaeon]